MSSPLTLFYMIFMGVISAWVVGGGDWSWYIFAGIILETWNLDSLETNIFNKYT